MTLPYGLLLLLKPLVYAKFGAPLALVALGLGAWCFFRESNLSPPACILGALAATLNSGFFSAACWGLASDALAVGLSFFAMTALASTSSRLRWWRVALAGFALGTGVMEGADMGAIFSVFVAAYALWQAWMANGPRARNAAIGVGRVALMAFCAFWLAAQPVSELVANNIKGVVRTQSAAPSKTDRWNWATQWSLPKRESLSLIVPGLFGYRMDTPNGGEYWGAIGRGAAWDKYFAEGGKGTPPEALLRYSGGGFYAGVLVALVALWAAIQMLRGKSSVFDSSQRKWLWFWSAALVVSLLLAFGRFAPFYRIIYDLPYFSTIRNPVKFISLLSFALVVLFAYGVDGFWRVYMEPAGAGKATPWGGLKSWWAKAPEFEKDWVRGCRLAFSLSVLAWILYACWRPALEDYLQKVRFDESMSMATAGFSIRQVGWFVLFLALASALMLLIFSGAFAGSRSKTGCVLLGLLLVVDLGRANQPWIIYWNVNQKYASNPIVDRLRQQPWEHRVSLLPFDIPPQLSVFEQLYHVEWLQHLFALYNVQSLDVVQMSRKPEDLAAFESAFTPDSDTNLPRLLPRLWQLTNTRYLLGVADYLDFLNHSIDPARQRFRIVERFEVVPKPGIDEPTETEQLTARPAPTGPFALFEFTGALPRAKLYTNWEINTNEQAVLRQITSASFDPERTVLVAGGLPPPPVAASTNQSPGNVEFQRYLSKDVVLTADAVTPSVLLLNDRFDPHWKVWVDGQPTSLLRCNYLMRGVYLPPGKHRVEFRFVLPGGRLCVSLAAIGACLLLLGFVIVAEGRNGASGSVSQARGAGRAVSRSLGKPDLQNTGTPVNNRRPSLKVDSLRGPPDNENGRTVNRIGRPIK